MENELQRLLNEKLQEAQEEVKRLDWAIECGKDQLQDYKDDEKMFFNIELEIQELRRERIQWLKKIDAYQSVLLLEQE